MDDLISRQAAIGAVFESAVGKRMLAGHKDLITILKSLPSAQPEQRWIPVSERLPELSETPYYIDAISGEKLYESERVLIFGENELGFDYSVASVVYSSKDGIYQWNGAYDSADTQMMVLAWMPLPEPYKEDNND